MGFLLVWDIDGTLIEGKGIGRRMMDKAFEQIYGIADGFRDVNMLGALDYNILSQAYSIHHITEPDAEAYFAKYCECLEAEVAQLNEPLAIEGILPLLDLLSNRKDFYHALGTGNIEDAARLKLLKDNLNRYFPVGGFSERETARWEVIEKAIIKSKEYYGLGFDNSNIYIIGDTPRDVECGKILRTKTVALAGPSYSPAQLYDCGTDYVLEDYRDIGKFLRIFDGN